MADTDDLQELFQAARAARDNAHAPYSGFAVGAAIRSESGTIYAGCNVENASYPEGWCAETSAIAQMVSAGETRIVAVLVMGAGERLCTPCGGCRQRLAEFAAPDTPIHIASPERIRQHTTLQELLPGAFSLLEDPS